MTKLSAVIITRNEEQNLPRCLDSVKWADEIIVIDSHSSDRTVEIAKRCGARVFENDWRGFGPAKQEGVNRASGEWVFSIDADEQVSSELAHEIKARVNEPGDKVGFYVPRQTQFLGRWIKHGGWYPDYVLRLFKRECGSFTDAFVHESVVTNGAIGRLNHDLRHFCYPSLDSYFAKFNRYTTLAAEELFRNGAKAGWTKIVGNPTAKFLKQYILRAGFLDGREGLILAILSSGYVLTKYSKLRDLHRKAHEASD